MGSINFLTVFKYFSFILFMLSLFTFTLPLVYSVYLEDEEILCYIIPIFIALFLYSLSIPIKSSRLNDKEALFVAVITWFIFPLLSTLSYVLSGYIKDPVDAYFESVSGFTTTGASILTDIEVLPKSLLLFRSLTNWIGGIGFVVLAISLLSTKLPIGRAIVKFESSRIIEERIEPRVKEVAKIVIIVYLFLSVIEVILLRISGLDLYNSLVYTFSTVATGGFAPKNASAGAFDNPLAEYIIAIFMILGAINLQLYYIAFKEKSLLRFFKDKEVITFLIILLLGVFFSTFYLLETGIYSSLSQSFRYAFFQITSAITTTGFSTTDYSSWPSATLALIMILSLFGAVGGSTGGGIKIYRLIFVAESIWGELKRIAHPHLVYNPTVRGKPVSSKAINTFWAFLSLYLFSVIFFGFMLTLGGHDLITSFSASVACITSLGPGLGDVGPASNFSSFSDWEKLLLSFEMILGRLEILPVITTIFLSKL